MINSLIFKGDSKVRDVIMVLVIVVAFFMLTQDKIKNEDNGYLREVEHISAAKVVVQEVTVSNSLPYIHKSTKPFEVYVNMEKYKSKDYNGKKAIALGTAYVNFTVFLGDKQIYEFKEDENKILGSGGGSVFSIIDLPKNINNDKIRIVFTPIIPLESYLIQPIVFADRSNIVLECISEDYPSIILLFLLFFLFIVIVVIYLASYKIDTYRKRLLGISLSSFVIGIYVFANLNVSTYIFSEYVGLLYFMEYVSLMFFPYPLIKFIEDDVNPVMKRIMKVCSIVIFINFFAQFTLVCFKIIEFRQLLPITHMITILIFANIFLCILFSEFENKKQKLILLLSVAPEYISMIILYFRYRFYDNSFFIRIFAFTMLLFVLVQLYMFIINYIQMSKENLFIKVYRKMTSIDTLTGLNNRYALNNALEEIRANPTKVTVISIDMNNLKIINDTLGHAFGDKAIIEVGNYLTENIPNSQVYRIGGDEFLVLSKDVLNEEEIYELNLKKIYIEEVSDLMDITFSIGMCVYDMVNVQSIDEAIIVSDMRMYENKESLKSQRKKRYIFTRK